MPILESGNPDTTGSPDHQPPDNMPDPPPPPNTDNPVTQWSTANEKTPPTQHGPDTPPGSNPNQVTAVDTATLLAYANYLETLIPNVESAKNDLTNVNVQPGAFYDADNMRTKINGTGGLSGQFQLMLGDLINGLTSIKLGLLDLATKYSDTESLNQMSVNDLQNEFDTAGNYFSNLMSDGGGSGIPNNSGLPNNPSNSNNSNNSNSNNSNNT
jgi:hypothetical protein